VERDKLLLSSEYEPGGYVDYGFSNSTLHTELTQFCENKNPTNKNRVDKWKASLSTKLNSCEEYLEQNNIKRVDPKPILEAIRRPADVFELWEKVEPFVLMSVSQGTSAGWLKHLFPNQIELSDTKANVFKLLKECHVRRLDAPLRLFLFSLSSSLRQLEHGKSSSVLVHVFPKHEPVKEKKLLEGRHRSIQMPDWTYVIIERICCAWQDTSTGIFMCHDEAYAKCGRNGARIGGWVFGEDVDKVLLRDKTPERVLDLDVSGWDKSLPFEMVKEIYRLTFHPHTSVIAQTCAEGYNGYGLFQVGKILFQLPKGATAWASGVNNTLCGNSQIHSALLDTEEGLSDHLVMGDDGNVVCDWSVERLTSLYAEAGLNLKKVETRPGWFFCKRQVVSDKLIIDWEDIWAKNRASCLGPLDQRFLNLLPMMDYYDREYGAPVYPHQLPFSVAFFGD